MVDARVQMRLLKNAGTALAVVMVGGFIRIADDSGINPPLPPDSPGPHNPNPPGNPVPGPANPGSPPQPKPAPVPEPPAPAPK